MCNIFKKTQQSNTHSFIFVCEQATVWYPNGHVCVQHFLGWTLSAHLVMCTWMPWWARALIRPSCCYWWTHCLSLCVCAGFWRLLSLQSPCCGEEGFVWPQGDAHQTRKRTTGKTVVSFHTAHCCTPCWQQKAKRQIGLHTQSVYRKR